MLAGEDSNMGSSATPSAASCDPFCCSASTTGCSGRCSVPPSWPAPFAMVPALVALLFSLPLPDVIPNQPLVIALAPGRS